MTQEILDKTIAVIEVVLADKLTPDSDAISSESSMENTPEWDSLNFVNIFLSVNEAFSIDPDPDDAINYYSVREIVTFVQNALNTA